MSSACHCVIALRHFRVLSLNCLFCAVLFIPVFTQPHLSKTSNHSKMWHKYLPVKMTELRVDIKFTDFTFDRHIVTEKAVIYNQIYKCK